MNVLVDKNKIDILANAISAKSGESLTLTLDEMVEAVDGIEAYHAPTLETVTKTYTPTASQQTDTITPSSGYDGIEEVDVTVNPIPSQYIVPTGNVLISQAGQTNVTNYATATVPYSDFDSYYNGTYGTKNNQRIWTLAGGIMVFDGGWLDSGDVSIINREYNAIPTGATVTPTESSQTIGGADTMMEGAVTVNAIPSNYVGSGITQRSSSDLTASGATVTVPSGYYSSQASKSVSNGTAGTPTATKGSVSNHSVSVTPSVTNTTGWITGSTINGTAVTVTASELVSGSDTVTQNDTYDVTNLAEIVVNVPSGGGSVTVTDEANATGITCVITSGGTPPTPSDIPLNTQLIDFTKITVGYIIIGSTGQESASQWSCCSDYTEIDPSMTFSYIGYQWYDYAFYDANKSYISGRNMRDDADSIANDYATGTLTSSKIPSTAKYIRISSYPTNPNTNQLSLIRTA